MEIKINSPKYGEKMILIDDEDYDKIKDYKWGIVKDRTCFYARRVLRSGKKQVTIKMHRLIMGDCNDNIIDHINHDGLDNRKSNLRICTHSENLRNCRKQNRNTTSLYKGVYFVKHLNKYCARITLNQVCFYLGVFNNEKQAAEAYNEAAVKYFGDFALLNEVE